MSRSKFETVAQLGGRHAPLLLQLDTEDLPLQGAPEELDSTVVPLADPSMPFPTSE